MPTYIYGLFCPVSDQIRYVGKADDPINRLTSHISAAKGNYYKHHTSRWLRKILSAGFAPRLVFLQQVEDGECWKEAERAWISRGRDLGWRLTNTAEGGEGVAYLNPEDEARFCAAVKDGVNQPHELARRGEEMKNRHKNPAWKAKIAAVLHSPEVSARRSASIKAARSTPESRAKTSAQAKAQRANPEYVRKLSGSIKAVRSSAESKAKTSAQASAQWANPEFCAKVSAKWRDKWIATHSHLPADEFNAELAKRDASAAKREKRRLAKHAAQPVYSDGDTSAP